MLFRSEEWRIPETKNGEPQTIPLVIPAIELLKQRKNDNKRDKTSPYVFASKSKVGHMVEPKSGWKRICQRATIDLWESDYSFSSLIEKIKLLPPTVYSTSWLFDAITAEALKRDIILPTGIMDVRLHDLRRTLGSYQAGLGTSLHIIGKSLGHKSHQATQVYARLDLDPVRESMKQATDFMISFGEVK